MKVNAVVLSLKSGTRAARAKLPVWFLVVTRRAATPSGRSLRSGRRRRQGSRPATARQGTAAGQALARLPAPPTPPPSLRPLPPPLGQSSRPQVAGTRQGKAASPGQGGEPRAAPGWGRDPRPLLLPQRSRFPRSSLPAGEAQRAREAEPGARRGP